MSEKKTGMFQLPTSWAEDWTLDKELGSGACSTVYRALRKGQPGAEAAIKVICIPADPAEIKALAAAGFSEEKCRVYYDTIAGKYADELERIRQFKGSANILAIEDVQILRRTDSIGNLIFVRMERLLPLKALTSRRPLTEKETLRAGLDVCDALELFSKRNTTHRDICPDNLFIYESAPGQAAFKLGDFSTVRTLRALTTGRPVTGAPAYAAPETVSRNIFNERSDLYSLGLTLYQLLNDNHLPFTEGKDPSDASEKAATTRRMAGEKIPMPRGGSEEAGRAILKACAFQPEDRYASTAEMKAALAEAQRKPAEAGRKKEEAARKKMKASPKETECARNETEPTAKKTESLQLCRKKTVVLAASVICATLLAAVLILTLGSTHAADGNQTTALPTDESPAVQAVLPEKTNSPETTDEPSVTEPAAKDTAVTKADVTEPSAPEPAKSSTRMNAPAHTDVPSPTQPPTSTPLPTPTPTPTPTLTPDPTPTPTPTPVPTPTPTVIPVSFEIAVFENDEQMHLNEGEFLYSEVYELRDLHRDSRYRMEIRNTETENLVISKLTAGREEKLSYDGSLDLSWKKGDEAGYWIYIDDVSLNTCVCRLMVTYAEAPEEKAGESVMAPETENTKNTPTIKLTGKGVTAVSEDPAVWRVSADCTDLQLRVSNLPKDTYSVTLLCEDESIAQETVAGKTFELDLTDTIRQKKTGNGEETGSLFFEIVAVDREMNTTRKEFMLNVEQDGP